jgi:hypothetical protein
MIIQMLAGYAATAITNAIDRTDAGATGPDALQRGYGSAQRHVTTSSLELDEILNKTLGQVMNYMKVEAGEIFLLEENKTTLRMVLHRGQAAEAFWARNIFQVGDGYPGTVAQTRQPLISRHLANDPIFLGRR